MEYPEKVWAFPWIYDSCGDSVISDESSIKNVLSNIAKKLDEIGADVVLLQKSTFFQKISIYKPSTVPFRQYKPKL